MYNMLVLRGDFMDKDKIINESLVSKDDLKTILSYIKSIEFGTVTLTIQNGKIVQIEKTEKYRIK